jgi:hypothetical protein
MGGLTPVGVAGLEPSWVSILGTKEILQIEYSLALLDRKHDFNRPWSYNAPSLVDISMSSSSDEKSNIL